MLSDKVNPSRAKENLFCIPGKPFPEFFFQVSFCHVDYTIFERWTNQTGTIALHFPAVKIFICLHCTIRREQKFVLQITEQQLHRLLFIRRMEYAIILF